MMQHIRKRLFVVLLFLVLVAAVMFYFVEKNNTATNTAYSDELTSLSKAAPAIVKSTAPVLPLANSENQAITAPKDSMQTAVTETQDLAIVNNWRDNHAESTLGNYEGYDLATLRQLVFNGDEGAVLKAARIYTKEGGKAAALKFYQEAAIHGSIVAVAALSSYTDANLDTMADPEVNKKFAIEALAYNEVAAMRGKPIYRSIYNQGYYERKNIFLSESDMVLAKERAQIIYDELQKSRDALGLGLFDNYVPEAVRKDDEKTDKMLK